MKERPKVSVGFVNCNRLFYLKSCVESFLECTEDYPNKEVIIVDNASIEEGTDEYLSEKEEQGITVVRREKRDPNNEFAKALNTICEISTGDYLCLFQGDTQFVVKGGWLQRYVDFFAKNKDKVGSIMFDAQRKIRNETMSYFTDMTSDDFKFVLNRKRYPINGAGECMIAREMIDVMHPWSESNESHEGGMDSETYMLAKIKHILDTSKKELYCAQPVIPVSVVIHTDSTGTNARVRGNKRYGDYWSPKESFKYYEILDYSEAIEKYGDRYFVVGIEELAQPIGWTVPLDHQGNWKKVMARDQNLQKYTLVDGKEEPVAEESPVLSSPWRIMD